LEEQAFSLMGKGFPESAILLNGVLQIANREIGAPRESTG
jgi:hypothetical protein